VLAPLDPFRELDLLRGREQRDLADVLEEELERVGRDLRLGLGLCLRFLGLAGVDDGDLGLLERGVEVVELRRLELQLVESERELVGVQLARAVPGFQESLALVADEDFLDRRASGSALRFFSGQTAPLPRRPSHGSCTCGGRQSNAPLGQVGPGLLPPSRLSAARAADRLEVAFRLPRERRARLRVRREPELALGELDAARPEQQHAEVEAHARIAPVRRGERAEKPECARGRVLVELADSSSHLCLDVAREAACGAVEDARRGDRPPDALQADAVEELLPHPAVLRG
jgi:hypothetical protein